MTDHEHRCTPWVFDDWSKAISVLKILQEAAPDVERGELINAFGPLLRCRSISDSEGPGCRAEGAELPEASQSLLDYLILLDSSSLGSCEVRMQRRKSTAAAIADVLERAEG